MKSVKKQVTGDVRDQVWKQVRDQAGKSVHITLIAKVWDPIWERVRVGRNAVSQVREEVGVVDGGGM